MIEKPMIDNKNSVTPKIESIQSINNNNNNNNNHHHHPRAPSNSKSKTIKPPGSNTTRVSVACDRCRKKKIRCFYDDDDNNNTNNNDGKRQCANCKSVGLECIFTDKLARKAFPRGYTESLEERVRELEYENKKLQKLLSLKITDDSNNSTLKINNNNNNNSQIIDNIKSNNNNNNNNNIDNSDIEDNINDNNKLNVSNTLIRNNNNNINGSGNHFSGNNESTNFNNMSDNNSNDINNTFNNGPTHILNTENVSRLDVEVKPSNLHTHDENCNCGMHHSLINRPVSIAGSVDIDHGDLSDDDSLYSVDSRQNSVLPFSPPNDSNVSLNNSNINLNNNINTNPNSNYNNNNNNTHGFNNINNPNYNSNNNMISNNNYYNNNYNNSNYHNQNYNNIPQRYNDNYQQQEEIKNNRFVFNPNSFEQINAPGAAAAISLQNKLRTKNFLNLANLIAASIPRSTEETLFIPTLLARIIKTHGFDSKAPYLTARSIALLKQAYNEDERYNLFPITFKGVNFNDLNKIESKTFFQSLNLPNNMNLDICITIFFNTWNSIIPVMNKELFMTNYKKFIKSRDLDYEDNEMIGFEKFGELLVIITCLVMISNERSNIAHKLSQNLSNLNENESKVKIENNNNNSNSNSNNNPNSKVSGNNEILQFYDHIIKQLIQSNMSSICSISSLQIITIELLYCLATDDLTSSYELRGRMITMCQQLRLHRCPAAVLGSNGSSVSKLQQGERRILFWCIYTLDSFSAFILGVPRLLKDYEIECALPSSTSSANSSNINKNKFNSDDNTSLITFQNNLQLSLVGKVCDSALSIMRYSKILGTIVDSIFKRSEGLKQTNINESKCLIMEDLLETWRRNLPDDISFNSVHNSKDINIIDNLNETQLTLYYLYYQAKALIYMPLLANESSYNLSNSNSNQTSSKCSPAFITIQQATTSILTTMKVLNSSKHNYYFLPLPINIARQMARFSLLAARNSLEYTRGGSLFQEAKLLLNNIINELKIENEIGLLGCLSNNCVSCLEHAIDAILSQPKLNSLNNSNNLSNNTANNNNNNLINNNLDITENLKKESKKKNVGSPLKNVSITVGDEKDKKIEKKSNNNNSNNKRKIAINDIFTNSEKEEEEEEEAGNERDKDGNEQNNHGITVKQEPELFNFFSADPKVIEEESLNKILKNVDDEDINNLRNKSELILEKQKLLIEQKQQFLQAQQNNLQKQILMLQHQNRNPNSNNLNNTSNHCYNQNLDNEPIMKISGQNTNIVPVPIQIQSEMNNNSHNDSIQQPMASPIQIDNSSNNKDLTYNGIKSFSDLLMFNDFGVDASLGLPLIDFELDTGYNDNNNSNNNEINGYNNNNNINLKKQKLENNGINDGYGYDNNNEHINNNNRPNMTFEDSPNYNPYENNNNNKDQISKRDAKNKFNNKKNSLFNWNMN